MKTRTTYDIVAGNGGFVRNLETKKDANKFIEESIKIGAIKSKSDYKIVPRQSEPYKLGELWRDDFDYKGMLRLGLKANVDWGVAKLLLLFASFDDVYPNINGALHSAIINLESGDKESAKREIEMFKKLCVELLEELKDR